MICCQAFARVRGVLLCSGWVPTVAGSYSYCYSFCGVFNTGVFSVFVHSKNCTFGVLNFRTTIQPAGLLPVGCFYYAAGGSDC